LARTVDTALDGPDRAAANLSGFLIGKAGSAYQDNGFALIRRQLVQRLAEVLQVHRTILRGMRCHRFGEHAVRILHLAAAFTHLAVKLVAQDGEEPGLHIRAHLEMILLGPGLHDGVLDKIIGPVMTAGQRNGEGPEAWQSREKFALEARLRFHGAHLLIGDLCGGQAFGPIELL
jgi:hypothetical protein